MRDTPNDLNLEARDSSPGNIGTANQRVAFTVSPLAYPLDEFYAQAGRPLPHIEAVEGDAVPEPYKTLLVHNNDMTPTLQAFHHAEIHLEVIRRQQRDGFYFREVVLLAGETNRPVEFGAIKMNLALFPAPARRDILEERSPLGQILRVHHIDHASRPKAFLKISADPFIMQALRITEPNTALYGRRNTLIDPMDRPLAEILEILPPAKLNGAEIAID